MLKNAFKALLLYIIGFAAAGALFGALGQALSYPDYKKSDLILGLFVPPSVKVFSVSVLIGLIIGGIHATFEMWRATSRK